MADTFTRLLGGRGGQHTLKAGFDVSVIRDRNYFPLNFAGTFTFTHDRVFDHASGYSYYVAYTLSSSERDTEDFRFFPQDQRNYAGDRGPGVNDSRQRLTAGAAVDLPFAFRLAGILTARTGLPFNITTGEDNNRDSYFTDRPSDTGRNAGRGDPFWQSDVRLSRAFTLQRVRLEMLAEVFNLTNHRNWIGPIGDLRSAQFGKPTAAAGARELQLEVRVEY